MFSRRILCAAMLMVAAPGLACSVPKTPAASTGSTASSPISTPPASSTAKSSAPAAAAPANAPTTTAPAKGVTAMPVFPFVQRRGAQLFLDGKPYRVVGVNAYELATSWGTNPGCGAMLDDATLDAFFASLPANTTVRIWGFQGSMATNIHTRARDWGPLDRVVNAATRHGDRLIVSLGNQAGACDDGHWKDIAWYRGGYRTLYGGDGYTIASTSYWDWIHEIVSRYKDSTTIAMWEPINEPEATECDPGSNCDGAHVHCPDQRAAGAAMRSFFDVVGTEIKRIDPNHLVESGALGGPQCGWVDDLYETVHDSPGIDVASYHDYESNVVVSHFLSERLTQTATLGKPMLVGELGVQAGDGATGCNSFAERRDQIRRKVDAELAAGAVGVLMWDWVPDPRPGSCTFDIGANDPVRQLFRTEN